MYGNHDDEGVYYSTVLTASDLSVFASIDYTCT